MREDRELLVGVLPRDLGVSVLDFGLTSAVSMELRHAKTDGQKIYNIQERQCQGA